MRLTPTQLRQNLYHTLDQILKTGEPVEIKRHGRILRIIPDPPMNRLEQLKPMKTLLNCEPDELNEIDWSKEWRP